MESEQLILYRLDQQDKAAEAYRLEVKDKLTRVYEQTLKTNGRVSALEKWRWTIGGAVAAVIAITTAMGAVVGWLVSLKSGH